MLTDTINSKNAAVSPLPWDSVSWTDGLWAERFDTVARVTVPHLRGMFEANDISHVLENFRICAGESSGEHAGTVFGDGDFYKWMEAALYAAGKSRNQALFDNLKEYAELIAKAQQPDGYISTKQIIGEMQNNGVSRLGDINDFEVYNFGHLFTAACVYKRVTGCDDLLNVAKKAANYLDALYKTAEQTGVVQTAVCPSHYMGLVELYRTTGDTRYLELARLAVRLRDTVKNGSDDNQDRIPLKEHRKIVGHAVRSNYLYAGVADICAECDEPDYIEMLHSVWSDLLSTKMYITGGCGALYNGVSPYGNFFIDQKIHQAYGHEYQLPNVTAYNETCAAIGCVLWAHRLFQLEPHAEYFDVIERVMLNTCLAAISLDGKRYFYQNSLRRAKKLPYKLVWELTRNEYILSYCCPPNLARCIAQSSEYAYAVGENTLYTGLYGASEAKVSLRSAGFTLTQKTEYPFDGAIHFSFFNVNQSAPFKLMLRIPSWSHTSLIRLNKKHIKLDKSHAGSYYAVEITDAANAELTLTLDMQPRFTRAHALVEAANGQLALERGPLVYCLESPDADVAALDELMLDPNAGFSAEPYDFDGYSFTALRGTLLKLSQTEHDPDALYESLGSYKLEPVSARFIPYFAWDNRGFGEMRVWLPAAFKK